MSTPISSAAGSAQDQISDVADHASQETANAMAKLRSGADAVVERLQPQIDAVSDYARDEPTKAMLIAAAAGAGLIALVALAVRSGSRPTYTNRISLPQTMRPSTMSSIRDSAIDLAERAHKVATSALGSAQSGLAVAKTRAGGAKEQAVDLKDRVSDRADQLRDDADDAAGSAADAIASMWKSVREQTAPVVEKLRPRIDAAASYARDEPGRTAAGMAAAGAALLGLIALLRRSDD